MAAKPWKKSRESQRVGYDGGREEGAGRLTTTPPTTPPATAPVEGPELVVRLPPTMTARELVTVAETWGRRGKLENGELTSHDRRLTRAVHG